MDTLTIWVEAHYFNLLRQTIAEGVELMAADHALHQHHDAPANRGCYKFNSIKILVSDLLALYFLE